MPFTTTPGMHIEEVDGAWLVLIPGRKEVAHLCGGDAQAFAYALQGARTIPTHVEPAMAALVELGVVTSNTWTRRKVLGLGGSAAAAAISVVALPSVAAASSTTGPPGPASLAISYLVVGGGGGTQTEPAAGGGGGGGVLQGTTTLERGSTTTVTVGAGGARGNPATNGSPSSLGAIAMALGGGYGAGPNRPAGTGASGGGGNGWASDTTILNPNGAPGMAGQGNAGGRGVMIGFGPYLEEYYCAAGGGGGGASEVGFSGTTPYPTRAGTGGTGSYSTIGAKCQMGKPFGWFGGGGTGASFDGSGLVQTQTAGVRDGGGGYGYRWDFPSPSSPATAGRPNTGGGGGGGGAAGGSGVVIVSYLTADAVGLTVTGGNKVIIPTDDWDDEANYQYSPADGKTYRLFTAVGTASLTIA